MNRHELENIHFNTKMMEHQDDTFIQERLAAHQAAAEAIADSYVSEHDEDVELPEDFENAVNFTTRFIYELGSPVLHPDDAEREIGNMLEWESKREKYDWVPESDTQRQLVKDLILRGSGLAMSDEEPAYAPHVNGRMHEALDPYSSKYNKFGMLLYPRSKQ